MDGYGISVDFDGRRLVVQPKNVLAKVALGRSRLVVTSAELVSASMTRAGLFRNGRLDLVVRDELPCQLHFTRKQQADFEQLYRGLLSLCEGVVTTTEAPRRQSARPRSASAEQVVGRSLMLRGRGWFGQEVVGESHYFKELRGLAGATTTGEREMVAQLRREPSNRHDRNAVQVLIERRVVGYLPRESAAEYAIPLQSVERAGKVAQCRARVWWRRGPGDFIASVSLDLADPAVLFAINEIDGRSRHMVIPSGRSYQLTRESDHLDVLGPLMTRVHPQGKALVVASLRVLERTGPRSKSEVVMVYVDGQEIGELTKQTSAKLLPIVRPLQEAGITCYADVVLTGNALVVEAKLNISPPEELPHDFVRQLQRVVQQA
ncbi:HIRAN domain-containing protein [Lentzea sp. NPDC092896]|uniref:HIRAN domain-containing protein n=1 Tax=Lentzea sp. NPDC092896 TaxID=3364127 RepID=UPI003830CF38